MALNYTGTGGIFTVLGKYFRVFDALNTVRKTTVYTEVQDAVNEYKKKTDADTSFDLAVGGLQQSEISWRASGSALASSIVASCQGFLTESIRADSLNSRLSITEVLEYLIESMDRDDVYVDSPTVGVGVTADAGNGDTDLQVVATLYGKGGATLDYMNVETVRIESVSGDALRFLGERSSDSKLSEAWPRGSGLSSVISPLTTEDSLLSNGDFEQFTLGDLPDGWIPSVGTPGVDYRATLFSEWNVVVSGTPTSGSYHIVYTDPINATVYSSPELSFDAGADALQAAMRSLPGLGSVVVTATGTVPDLTHTIVFEGVAGQVPHLAAVVNLDQGSVALANSVAGDLGATRGRGLYLPAARGEVVLHQEVRMDADRVYAFGMWAYASSTNPAPVVVSLTEGIGGSAIGLPVEWTIENSGWTHVRGFLRLPKGISSPAFLKVSVTDTSPAPKTVLVVDSAILSPAIQLYAGGPYVATFQGRKSSEDGDKWLLATTNDYGGKLQQKFNQIFPMAENGLQLPTSGATNIPDSLIS